MDDKRTLKLLILLAGLLTIGSTAYYLVWNFTDILPRVGSVTEYATVFQVQYNGATGYCYEIHNETETIYRSPIDTAPYIRQSGRDVIVKLQGADEYYIYNLDTEKERVITMDEYEEKYPILWYYPFTYLEKRQFTELNPENDDVLVLEASSSFDDYWYWFIKDHYGDSDEQLFWLGESETLPECTREGDIRTVFFTEEGQTRCKEFNSKTGWESHIYNLYDDNKVYVEQLTDILNYYDGMYDDLYSNRNVKTTGFVNTKPVKIGDCNEAYMHAKNEVSIPYDLVTFRFDFWIENNIAQVDRWEVTFSTKDDPTAPNAVVYMNGDGVTELVVQ